MNAQSSAASRVRHLTSSLVLCLLALALAVACQPAKNPGGASVAPGGPPEQATVVATGARRADPGYIQYLERLSMLGSQTDLARVVSGSQLAWLRPADSPFPEPLLGLADSWLAINPQVMLPEGKRSIFATLASPTYWHFFNKARIGGLYLAPATGSGALWAYNRKASVFGDDAIQYTFSEAAGPEEDYFRLLDAANANRKLLGLDLTPAATGLGPDFFLATRYHRQFSGAYCMVELPPKTWPMLPAVSDQWHGAPLSGEQIAFLAAQHLLPRAMAQDFLPAGKRGGWAVTGEIYGVDGLLRRWAYRYHDTPDRPVLNWEDPSAGARTIVSGSAVRNVGMLGGALVGMRLQGLYGLEAATPNSPTRFAASPGDEAARTVAREVRRYGGWFWLQDEIPLSLVADLMPDGPDFFQDTIFSPGIEHALLTGSTAVLDAMLDDALLLDLDMRRFVHSTSAERGVSYALPHLAAVAAGDGKNSMLLPDQAAALQKDAQSHAQQAVYGAVLSSPRGEDIPPLQEKTLCATTAGIAALALGKGNVAAIAPEDETRLRDGLFLQVFVRAMLPGLFMLSGQDIAGTLPLSWYAMADNAEGWDAALAARGAYAFTQSVQDTAVTALGVPRAKTVHPPADVQIVDEHSFLTRLANIMAIRTAEGIANGALHGRFITSVPGCFAFAVILPAPGEDSGEQPAPVPAPPRVGEPQRDGDGAELETAARTLSREQRHKREQEKTQRLRTGLEHRILTAPATARATRANDAAIVAVFNFSRDTITETLNLAHDPTLRGIREKGGPELLDAGTKDGARLGRSPGKITLTLPPWSGAAVRIGKR